MVTDATVCEVIWPLVNADAQLKADKLFVEEAEVVSRSNKDAGNLICGVGLGLYRPINKLQKQDDMYIDQVDGSVQDCSIFNLMY